MADYPNNKLYRTRWTGDRSTIVGLLQSLNLKIDRTNELLEQNNLLLTMIVDNTNCACEQLKIIADGKKPPVEIYPDLFYSSKKLYTFEKVPSQWSAVSYYLPVKSVGTANTAVGFDFTSVPDAWLTSLASRELDPQNVKEAEYIGLGYTHMVSFEVLNNDPTYTPVSTTIEITQQGGTGLTDTLTVYRYVKDGSNPATYLFQWKNGTQIEEHTFDETGGSKSFEVGSSKDGILHGFDVVGTSVPDWLSVSINGIGVTVQCVAGNDVREAEVFFLQNDSGKQVILKVKREPGYIFGFKNGIDYWEAGKSAGGSSMIVVSKKGEANQPFSWDASTVPDWLSVTLADPVLNLMSTLVLPNTGIERDALVKFIQDESGKESIYRITQAGLEIPIEIYDMIQYSQPGNHTVKCTIINNNTGTVVYDDMLIYKAGEPNGVSISIPKTASTVVYGFRLYDLMIEGVSTPIGECGALGFINPPNARVENGEIIGEIPGNADYPSVQFDL